MCFSCDRIICHLKKTGLLKFHMKQVFNCHDVGHKTTMVWPLSLKSSFVATCVAGYVATCCPDPKSSCEAPCGLVSSCVLTCVADSPETSVATYGLEPRSQLCSTLCNSCTWLSPKTTCTCLPLILKLVL